MNEIKIFTLMAGCLMISFSSLAGDNIYRETLDYSVVKDGVALRLKN